MSRPRIIEAPHASTGEKLKPKASSLAKDKTYRFQVLFDPANIAEAMRTAKKDTDKAGGDGTQAAVSVCTDTALMMKELSKLPGWTPELTDHDEIILHRTCTAAQMTEEFCRVVGPRKPESIIVFILSNGPNAWRPTDYTEPWTTEIWLVRNRWESDLARYGATLADFEVPVEPVSTQ